jgi:type II secretory pathway predicted ATPase ExeA
MAWWQRKRSQDASASAQNDLIANRFRQIASSARATQSAGLIGDVSIEPTPTEPPLPTPVPPEPTPTPPVSRPVDAYEPVTLTEEPAEILVQVPAIAPPEPAPIPPPIPMPAEPPSPPPKASPAAPGPVAPNRSAPAPKPIPSSPGPAVAAAAVPQVVRPAPPPPVSSPDNLDAHLGFYGLSGAPFSLLPDAEFLYLSDRYRSALNLLDYGLASQTGFVVITGEVGAGKTTVIRRFLHARRGHDLAIGLVTNATAASGGVMSWISTAFELEHRNLDHIALYNQFVEFVVARYAEGKRTLIIIDEAQNLSVEMLEDLRMLSNINNEKDLLLQVVLAGQPELVAMLKRPELRQFGQRIGVHYHLEPLNCAETIAYIGHRLTVVGGRRDLFEPLAAGAVHYFSGGVPRLINLLCDAALVYGFADNLERISIETIIEVAADRAESGLTPFRPLPGDRSPATFRALVEASLATVPDAPAG